MLPNSRIWTILKEGRVEGSEDNGEHRAFGRSLNEDTTFEVSRAHMDYTSPDPEMLEEIFLRVQKKQGLMSLDPLKVRVYFRGS